MKQSGGYIWVYSELGHGTTFKVYLPRVEEAVEVTPDAKATLTPPPLRERSSKETILLVEDEPELRELTRTVLAARGYKVIEAVNAEEAERLANDSIARGTKIHLLLTDVIMPGVSGRELAKRVLARQPSVRVLYMSGYTYNVIAQNGTLESGVAFLQKPFSPSGLVEKVREVLDMVVQGR